jgi:hypothetical protein
VRGVRAAPALAALLAGSAHAQGCGADLGGAARRVESDRYVVAYTTGPAPIAVGEHFIVDFAVCPRGAAAPPQSVRVDAGMPEHRHGMNYRPAVTVSGNGRYRAEGLLFHMSGRWDLTFDIVTARGGERLTSALEIE